MKSVIAFLLGLTAFAFADVVLEFESPDSAEEASETGEGSSVTYNGIIIQVRQDSDTAPTIALGSDIDSYDDVYCLNFIGLFEASEYDTTVTTNGAYTEIDDTRIDLADGNCTTSQESNTVFTINCNNVGDGALTLKFTFTEDDEGDYGLEYTISLEGYELSDDTAKLVMVQSLNECGDLIDIDAESVDDETDEEEEDEEDEEEEEEENDNDATDEPESTETPEPTETEATETPESTDPEERRRLVRDEDDEEDDTDTTDMPESTDAEDQDDEEEDEEEDDEESEETDDESLEEEDGISEDDSGEFDTGFARFVVNGQALDSCASGNTEIDSTLVYQPDDDELHIVFDPFNCTLVLDPFYGLDNSKYESVYSGTDTPAPTTEDNAQSMKLLFASIIGLIAWLW